MVVAITLIVLIDMADDIPEPQPPERQADIIAKAFERSSVYVAPGAPGLVDPERSRRAIGDLPVLVAILATSASDELCWDVVGEYPDTALLMFGENPVEDHAACGRWENDRALLEYAERAATYLVPHQATLGR
ncbi:hypothetical protein [Actinophytocola xanthii]|uniref:hypothetical protein n=1 Tax=Actinophytocola xanthii TaxID=1912961 RepID=UPI001177465D|nr:hypothetical protein [Actinophytocola xanthii]